MWTPSRPLGMTSARRLGGASKALTSVAEGLDSLDQWGHPSDSWAQGLVGAGTPEDGFHHGKKEALRGARLAPSIDPSLNDPETVKYRETYRRHRRQGTEMLEHAARSPNLRSTPGPGGSPILRCESGNLEDVVEEPSGGVHGMNEMYEDEKGYSRLLRWRLAYQAHRLGKARGAQGEMGASLTLSDVQMLPVARLAGYYRQTRLRSSTASPTPDDRVRPVHVHVGAGRLALGLVLPALVRGATTNKGAIVLLQRPSEAWKSLADGSLVRFSINSVTVCALRVVRSGVALPPLPSAGGEVRGFLVLSEEEALLDDVAARSTSLSCSLGPALEDTLLAPGGLTPIFSALERVRTSRRAAARPSDRLSLFAAENDHEAVSRLADSPRVKALHLSVVALLVDRVCTDRVIGDGAVDTSAEPWRGEIVVMTPTDAGPAEIVPEAETEAEESSEIVVRRHLMELPPLAGESVRWPRSGAEAHFLHRRKILTVNGTHTTLAFLTLAQREPPPHSGLPLGSYELLRAVPDDGASSTTSAAEGGHDSEAEEMEEMEVEETRRAAWAWVVARQLMLLYETSLEVAYSALGCEGESEKDKMNALVEALLAGARTALDRLGRGGDTTKRILGGGVVNRFRTRLKPISAFFGSENSARWMLGRLPRLLLRRAKLSETAMRHAVFGLTADAERFTVSSDVSLDHASPPPSRQRSKKATPMASPMKTAAATPEKDAAGRRGPAAPPASPLVLPPDVAALNIE